MCGTSLVICLILVYSANDIIEKSTGSIFLLKKKKTIIKITINDNETSVNYINVCY